MPPDAAPVITRRGLRLGALVVAAAAIAIVAFGLTSRKMVEARLSKWTEEQAVPVVAVAKPDTRGQSDSINLPGRLQAYAQAQLFARVSGYLRAWHADIGTPVRSGQLLAEIDAPDLDQQIMQATANLAAAKANAELAATTLQRGQSLMPTGAISKQVLDQRIADANNKQGLFMSAQADLDRLRVLEGYKRITAPFDGLVTARATDVGALINAGGSGGPALFVVSDVGRLRLYVNVPQNFVPSVRVGTKAQFTVPEYPGRSFTATVEASAQSVDPASGTTRMQLVVDNAKGELMTGAYATVRLTLSHPDVAVNVPASALIINRSGLRVATVGDDNRIVLKQVAIRRDLGSVVEIESGLTPEDRVVVTPPDGVAQGDVVRVVGSGLGKTPLNRNSTAEMK
jgi:RND family efflux transporter MFP subunit